MLSKLPPRERQIVDILYERGPLAVTEICDALPVLLSGSAVRAMLKRLEDKGYVTRSESERGFLYSPAVSDTVAKKSALSEIVRVFFNGSPASAASALLGMSDKLKEDELEQLEQMIARARKAKGGQ
ncbi:MAG: BlaI/MecI/CopY family transcriptional regulator [Sphingomicrobium sp.]